MNDSFDTGSYGDDLLDEMIPKRSRSHFLPLILVGGMATTLGTLVLIFVLSMFFKTNILSFVVYYILPIGAIFAGAIAGSGYAVTARILQYRPSTGFILFVCLLQFVMFFAGRYIEYLPVRFNPLIANPPPFGAYYRFQIEESEWTTDDNKQPFKMGKKGWLLEVFTALCFSLASLIGPAVLAAFAYCGRCRLFMKKGLEFTFPARAVPRKIKKNDIVGRTAYQEEDQAAFEAATGHVVRIIDFLNTEQSKDRAAVYRFLCDLRDEIAPDPKAFKGVLNSVKVTLYGCNECDNYQLVVMLEIANINDKSAMKPVEFLRFVDGNFVVQNLPASNTFGS